MIKSLPFLAALTVCPAPLLPTAEAAEQAHNPIIHADVPDMAMIRVGDTYYMSSTSMHMSPNLPIMKSKDLVNWELAAGLILRPLLEVHPSAAATGLGLSEAAKVHIQSLRMLTDAMDVFVCEPRNDLLSERSSNEAYCLAEPGRQ